MQTVLLIVHLFIALALIGIVLMQRSEGGALGIGGGGAGSLFSARGVGNTLTRATAVLAVLFFITSISLTLLARHGGPGSLFEQPASPSQSGNSAPATNPLPQLPSSEPAGPKVPVSP
ncbi:MAG: preprotein translocase subunit SecG [Hyphomicrobiales bacterium]